MSSRQRKSFTGCSVGERDGRLRLRFRWQGRARSIATGLDATADNEKQLRRLAELVGACIRAGKDPTSVIKEHIGDGSTEKEPIKAITVRDYYERWIVEQTQVVRKAQARDYRRHLEKYVMPVLGDVGLADLRPADVRGLQAELLSRKLSVKFVKNIMSGSLRALIRSALIDEHVTRDVFVGLRWPRWRPPGPDPLTAEERDRIIEWFRTQRFAVHRKRGGVAQSARRHPSFHAIIQLLFFTGMRPSEASGLQWGDLDLDHQRLHVRRSRHLYEYGDPKTASAERSVQLLPETVVILRDLRAADADDHAPVFLNTAGNPVEPKVLHRHWQRALEELRIRHRGLYEGHVREHGADRRRQHRVARVADRRRVRHAAEALRTLDAERGCERAREADHRRPLARDAKCVR
jgi:integrase